MNYNLKCFSCSTKTVHFLIIITYLIHTQSAALVAVTNVYDCIDEASIKKMVLPKIKMVFEKNHTDVKIVANVLSCIERTLEKLDKAQVNIYEKYDLIFIISNKIYFTR